MTAPVRIQLRRIKGWRMPENTVKVTRPGPWGNPFPLSGFSREEAVRRFDLHASAMAIHSPQWLAPLRGKNLACFCPEGVPCHADVLLRLANVPSTLSRPRLDGGEE